MLLRARSVRPRARSAEVDLPRLLHWVERMPNSHRISAADQLARVRGWGRPDVTSAIRAIKDLARDPEFEPHFNVLVDAHALEDGETQLEKAARALEETVRALGENPARRGRSLDGSGFGARRGSLRPPISARIVRGFGRVVDAEFLTQTFRKGVEFGAKTGESVRAVAPGEVRFGGWFRGYGKIVIVDHGDRYFTVYGHLSDLGVEVGAFLREGDRIGSSGETGSLTGPSLYFEIRHGSESLNPEKWLGPTATG